MVVGAGMVAVLSSHPLAEKIVQAGDIPKAQCGAQE